MTQAAGAHSAYDEPIATGGNREDLSDVVFDVSPVETPLITAMKKGKATGINHEWLQDRLAAAADNKRIEGDDASPSDPASRNRYGNYTQILSKDSVVTGTQEKVLKGGGIKSEMAYQVARRMKEMKKDLEFAIIGQSNAKVAGNDSTAREMGSFDSYVDSGDIGLAATGSTNPTGDGSDVSDYAGTNRTFTETIFTAALQALWTKSGGNENLLFVCNAANRAIFSTFAGSNTRYVSTDDRKLTASIDVFDGDFHTVTATPSRQCQANVAYIVDPEYAAIADLRPIHSYDLAKTGDSYRKEIIWETTFEMCDHEAQYVLGDLST